MARTIVLIHGAWLTPASWQGFRHRYEAKGYSVLSPAWPYLDAPPSVLRKDPDPRLAHVGISAIVDHYSSIISELSEPPILMGHSFAGLFVQVLLDRGLGAAGVAIDPAPPFGILPNWRGALSALPVFTSWNGWNRVLSMSTRGFATTFAQTLPEAEMSHAYSAFVAPTPGRVYFEQVLGIGCRVKFANAARPPLLLIAGEKDRTVPLVTVKTNYRKQRAAASRTTFKAFPGRSHWICKEAGWEGVADFALTWAEQQVVQPSRPQLVAVGG
jgi:pimeloyl-ACP methyl ester carboxylesterase